MNKMGFWEEKAFTQRDIETENSLRCDSNHQLVGYVSKFLPLSYLTCWWVGIK